MGFWDAEYRQWKTGEWEKLKPESLDDVKPVNREERIRRCIRHIGAGADRDICRVLVRTEEEWRAACGRAGTEPGRGWLVRPDDIPGQVHITSGRIRDESSIPRMTPEDWQVTAVTAQGGE